MTEPKATQCPVCKKGKREQDKYCSEKCAMDDWQDREAAAIDEDAREPLPAVQQNIDGTIDTCDVCGEELDPVFGRCQSAFHEQEKKT